VHLKYYCSLAVGVKSSFTAHLRMVLPSVAERRSLALGCSVLQGPPRLVLHPRHVVATRDACDKKNPTKTQPKKAQSKDFVLLL